MENKIVDLGDKADPAVIKFNKERYNNLDSSNQKKAWANYEEACDQFYKTDSYSDTKSWGYGYCCEIFNDCGTSGWVIFLIIVLVLGILAGGTAAFWFFYGKRKFGGQEEENTESTENQKSVIQLPIGNY